MNQWDFERLFAERSCVHDSDLVYELAKDPSFRPTDDQRKQHFVDNREMSFGIMMSFAGFMVYEQTTNPDMRVISMATAYNVLKGVFNPEPGASATPSKADGKPSSRTK
jgi:glutamate synthase domain-containing protein 1